MDFVSLALPSVIAGLVTLALLSRRSTLWRLSRPAVNFEGIPICPMGLAVVLGIAAGTIVLGYPTPVVIAALGFGLFGWLDDALGDRSATGFKGHLRAAAGGRLTTGFWKIVGGGLTALLAAYYVVGTRDPLRWLLAGGVIALAANAFNLVDTRPVRATALFLALMALPAVLVPTVAIPVVIPALVWLPWDRRRRAMLGDAGSNALGAVCAVFVAPMASSIHLYLMLALLIAFHVWTEKHSVNAAIAAHPWLDRLDRGLRGPAVGPKEHADEPCA